ncbi:Reticuline oxidase [Mycena sanguinolenta]|uniref:Reticuline oxidase n=1 Tax=Mycena sanguinolenta TaxID=230812 RepID=A0A8H6Z1R3_9AGAR|nr:Reticuline oxidase [Mycena sanguinolenta]
MGNSQSLPPASQAGSPLQLCLSNVFPSSTGSVSYPQDIFYQSADVKVYNQHIPITPAAVTRPTTSEEISKIVQCAVASGVKVQARSGGHSYGNYGIGGQDNAVVVDMVNFQIFSMNTSTWEATVGAGTLLGDLTTRLHNAGGRAIAYGTSPQIGIGGHATIGGLGRFLANGAWRLIMSSRSRLSWLTAMKGAAASFGIATEFVFLTYPEPTTMTQYSYKIELGKHADMASTFATWQSLIADPALDRKLASQVTIFELTMIISGTYFGTEQEYRALNFEQQLTRTQNATVLTVVSDDWLGVVDNWAEEALLALSGGLPAAFYSKSLTFSPNNLIPGKGVQNLFNYFDNADKGTPFAIFDLEGGAVNDVSQDATAFAHRDTLFYMQSYAVGLGTLSNTTIAFLTGLSNTITDSMPGVQFGAYPGYVDPLLKDGPLEYWGGNLVRLQQIKEARDPGDLFHNPQSVPVA